MKGDDVRSEYDLSELKNPVRGKYYDRAIAGTKVSKVSTRGTRSRGIEMVSNQQSSAAVQDGPKVRQPATGRSPSESRPAPARMGPLPIEEIYALYPGEWVAVKVTALDERQAISHGEVLAHSRSQRKVNAALSRARQGDPTMHIYLFFGGSEPATEEEWQSRLTQAAEKIKDYKDYLYAGR